MIPLDFEIFAYASTRKATTNTKMMLFILSNNERTNPVMANIAPIPSASNGLILPEGIGL